MITLIKLSLFSLAFSFSLFSIISVFNFFITSYMGLLGLGIKWAAASIFVFILTYTYNKLSLKKEMLPNKPYVKLKTDDFKDLHICLPESIIPNIETTENIQKVRKYKRYSVKNNHDSIQLEFLKNKQYFKENVIIHNVSKSGVYLTCDCFFSGKERSFALKLSNDIPSQDIILVRTDVLPKNKYGYAFQFAESYDMESQKNNWTYIEKNLLFSS